MTELHTVDLASLESHPWQVNIPDMVGAEWDEFLEDVRKRGIQDPIRVSYRTGAPVIVDGHQRSRAARELGIERLTAIIQEFEDEAAEVEYLAGAARYRRNLTNAQKVQIAMKYKEYFRPQAEASVGGRPKAGEEKPPQNFGEVSKPKPSAKDRETDARAAAVVGISREQLRQGEAVIKEAPEPIKKAWEAGEVATHVAYDLTRKAPEPVRQALIESRVDVPTATGIMKDPTLRKDLEDGSKTVEETVSIYQAMRQQREEYDSEVKMSANHKMTRLLTAITDISQQEWDEVHNSIYNRQMGGTFRAEWIAAAQHMLALAEGHDTFTIDQKVIDG